MLSDELTLTRPMIGLDLETTGRNPEKARIVEIGLEIYRPGLPIKVYRSYVNPTIPIPPASTEIHHITDDMVRNAPTFDALADNLLRGFTDADFTGYNVRYDLRVVAAEFRRAKRTWDYEAAHVIDSFRLWQHLDPRSLDDAIKYWIGVRLMDIKPELARAYLVEIEDSGAAHGAGRDVVAAARVTSAQLICSTLPRDPAKLHALCSPGWYDAEGKLQWMDGELCFAFGKHRDECIKRVPRDYLNFVCRGTFSQKVKDVCREAMHGRYVEQRTDHVEERNEEEAQP